MGHKVRPTSLRLGITRNWTSRWYANKKDFGPLLVQDHRIRNYIKHEFYSAGIPEIEIERSGHHVTIHLHAARPGVVIGKRGAKVEQLREDLQGIVGKEADLNLNIKEVQNPGPERPIAGRERVRSNTSPYAFPTCPQADGASHDGVGSQRREDHGLGAPRRCRNCANGTVFRWQHSALDDAGGCGLRVCRSKNYLRDHRGENLGFPWRSDGGKESEGKRASCR